MVVHELEGGVDLAGNVCDFALLGVRITYVGIGDRSGTEETE